jgi:signal peptidase
MSRERLALRARLRRGGVFFRRVVGVAAILAFGAWFVLLRPQALGGTAGYVMVAGVSMQPTLEPGTLVVVVRQASYEVGDVVAYRITEGDIAAGSNVIHRIVGEGPGGYLTEGDNTTWHDPWHPSRSDVIGKVTFTIPGAVPTLMFLRSPLFLASLAAGFGVYVVLGLTAPRPSRAAPSRDASSPATAVRSDLGA